MTLRELERASIRAFVQKVADHGYLQGRVLDLGCGSQPYRDIVEAVGGEYVGFDRAAFPANVSGEDVGARSLESLLGDWHETVLCTQVLQLVPNPAEFLLVYVKNMIRPGGHLVMTYPTTWPEREPEDLWRFTRAGMEHLLASAAFNVVIHDVRAYVTPQGAWNQKDNLALGYGVVARA